MAFSICQVHMWWPRSCSWWPPFWLVHLSAGRLQIGSKFAGPPQAWRAACSGGYCCLVRWELITTASTFTFDLTFATSPLSHTVVTSTTTFDCFKMMLKPFRIRCLYDSSPGVVQLTTVQYDCEPLQPFLLSSLFSSSL